MPGRRTGRAETAPRAYDAGADNVSPARWHTEQPPGSGTGTPAGAVEDLVIGCKVGGLGPAGHAQEEVTVRLPGASRAPITRTRTCSQLGAVKQGRHA